MIFVNQIAFRLNTVLAVSGFMTPKRPSKRGNCDPIRVNIFNNHSSLQRMSAKIDIGDRKTAAWGRLFEYACLEQLLSTAKFIY